MTSLITATTVWGQRGQIATVLIVWLVCMLLLAKWVARRLDERSGPPRSGPPRSGPPGRPPRSVAAWNDPRRAPFSPPLDPPQYELPQLTSVVVNPDAVRDAQRRALLFQHRQHRRGPQH